MRRTSRGGREMSRLESYTSNGKTNEWVTGTRLANDEAVWPWLSSEDFFVLLQVKCMYIGIE